MPNHPGSRGHSQCLNPNLNPKALFFPQCIMKLCMVSINYFIAWCLERESEDILTIALNITLDLHKWQQSEGWLSQMVRKTVYGLHTSAQETVLTLRLTIPIYTIRDENPSLLFSCYNQRKRETLCWLFSVFKGGDQVPDCEDAACWWSTPYLPLIGFWVLFLQDLIRNALPGALIIWRFSSLLLSHS